MTKLKEIIGSYDKFLDAILMLVVEHGFDLDDFIQIDHICYRTISMDNYIDKKKQLEGISELLGEVMVNGRPISTFRVRKPIIHGKWRIDAVELPAPKVGDMHKEGLEHIEFVIYDDMPTFLKKYEGKNFDLKAADRGVNPEVGYKLGGGMSVKFHLLNLPTAVYLEKKLGFDDVRDGK